MPYLVVASTGSGPYPHPVEVAIHPNGRDTILAFSIGPHVVNAGGLVALAGVLDEAAAGLNPLFATEFDAAELHWLVPLLVRLHKGEDVKEEIVSGHRERHGKNPSTTHIARRTF